MKTILDLSNIEAKEFFLKEKCYRSFELPEYFIFQDLLDNLKNELSGKKLDECTSAKKPKDVEGVNYTLFNNKDGKYAWRPFQLIHPALYVLLVQEITNADNWELIKKRFIELHSNKKIECHSLPVVEGNQIHAWWQLVEQRALTLSLDFKHLLHLDITDCYSSVYTHSIAWAIHSIEEAKKPRNRNNTNLVGVVIDKLIQSMSFGQTNGIPQGSILMDFIAEVVLGLGDWLFTQEIIKTGVTDYKIIRYRDDYRIFTNSVQESSEIAKVLSEILIKLNFKVNSSKTRSTDDLVLGSLKEDKVHWIYNKRKTDNVQQWLIQLYVLGKEFPNSGSLFKETKLFLVWLINKENSEGGLKLENIPVLISILVNLAYNNPRLFELVTASLSFIISKIQDIEEQKEVILKIINKFSCLPNTDYLNVWLQRLTLKINTNIPYSGKLCEKVLDKSISIWNSDWLNTKLKKIVEEAEVINDKKVELLETKFTETETEQLVEYDYLFS